MEQKIALYPFGGTFWGKRGPGESFLRSRVQWACTTCLFLLDLRATCTVFPVFAMFAMTTMAQSDANPGIRIPGYKHKAG